MATKKKIVVGKKKEQLKRMRRKDQSSAPCRHKKGSKRWVGTLCPIKL